MNCIWNVDKLDVLLLSYTLKYLMYYLLVAIVLNRDVIILCYVYEVSLYPYIEVDFIIFLVLFVCCSKAE